MFGEAAGGGSREKRLGLQFTIPLLAFVLSFLVTSLAIVQFQIATREADSMRVESAASDIAARLTQRLNLNIALLRGAGALFAVTGQLNRATFGTYVGQLDLRKNYPAMQGMGFTIRIRPEAVPALSRMQAAFGYPGFRVWPKPAGGEDVHSIVFLEPDTPRNRAAIGFNMFSEPRRREAMEKARDTALPHATGNVMLLQEITPDRQAGFLVYYPVYANARVPETVEQRRRQLRGFVYIPYRAGNLMSVVLNKDERSRFNIAAYNGAPQPQNLLYRNDLDGSTPPADAAVRSVTFAGRTILLQFWPHNGQQGISPLVRGLWIAAVAASLLVAALTWALVRQGESRRMALADASEQQRVRDLLLRELNHRVKNTLATVVSMASLTRRSARDIDDYYERFSDRVHALAATHDLLTRSNWQSADLRRIVEAEVTPYRNTANSERITISGPDVPLRPSRALSLGLGLHELATNSAKYGALSVPDGRVEVEWSLSTMPDGRVGALVIDWREYDGPPVAPPQREGFGSLLLQRALGHELGGSVELHFPPEGVRCRITVPPDYPGD